MEFLTVKNKRNCKKQKDVYIGQARLEGVEHALNLHHAALHLLDTSRYSESAAPIVSRNIAGKVCFQAVSDSQTKSYFFRLSTLFQCYHGIIP